MKARRPAALALTRFGARDIFDEALSAVVARPGRAMITVTGTVLGIAAFVAVLGLAATAAGQISQRFTALSATEVLIEDGSQAGRVDDPPFPPDAEARLAHLNGVARVGTYWEPDLPQGSRGVSARPPGAGGDDPTAQPLTVLAASPGYLSAIHARLSTGRLFDAFHDRRGERVCVLGGAAARQLGISRVDQRPAIFLGSTALTVIGILADVDRNPEALLSVVVPRGTAQQLWGPPDPAGGHPARMLVETRVGAAALVGRQAPFALRPADPGRFKVTVPPDPRTLRNQVNTDVRFLFLGLAAISLVIGTLGIANTTLVMVLERVGEIGLRRAVGARRKHVAVQFLGESGLLGLLGGLVGASIGVGVVVVTAVIKQWTPILDPVVVLSAPLLGALTGLVAGAYPSWRASRIEPQEALRR
jgi:putative ABC transport system permease protein